MNITKTINKYFCVQSRRIAYFHDNGRSHTRYKDCVLNYKPLTKITILTVLIFANSIFCICNAASQGKLGKHSSASIDISIQVNQTFTTISPEELLLSQATVSDLRTFKPFCVAHHGYSQNARVPYELRVEELKMSQKILNSVNKKYISSPYKIYLEDKNTLSNRLRLLPGVSVTTQSVLSFSDQIKNECANTGVHISIEMTNSFQALNTESIPPGLLILLVTPN